MAVLRQQLVFVERMAHSGMVTGQEAGLMAEPIDTRIRVLAHRGPTWRAPLVIDVLRSLPIMRQVDSPFMDSPFMDLFRLSKVGCWRTRDRLAAPL